VQRVKSRLAVLGGLVVVAAAIVIAAVAISQSGSDDDDGGGGSGAGGAAETAPRDPFEGIPQDGNRLGEAGAETTVVEFADMQCPFCAEFATGALAEVVDRYVRPGRIALELDVLAFLGPDSRPAAEWAAAASLQDRMWQFTETFFQNQGTENSGYVTEEFLADIARQAGLDLDRLRADLDDPRVARMLRQSASRAERFGISGTPSFVALDPGADPRQLELQSLDADAFGAALGDR
jgi:protein-disulfide isomerase